MDTTGSDHLMGGEAAMLRAMEEQLSALGISASPATAPTHGAAWALAWFESTVPSESYVNLIPTVNGGTHESGLREGLFASVKSFAELHGLLPKGVKLLPEDVFARTSFVLSAKVLDPQFQGQIKERLNSRDAVRREVQRFVLPAILVDQPPSKR